MQERKKCHYCGADARIYYAAAPAYRMTLVGRQVDKRTAVQVGCLSCGARGPVADRREIADQLFEAA